MDTLSLDILENGAGFAVGSMSANELETIRTIIREQYLHRLLVQSPKQVHKFFNVPMTQYHQLSDLIDHRAMWPKTTRIVGPASMDRIKSLPFFKNLTDIFDIKALATEEGCGWQEMYWRIVRPGQSDIGDYHADRWFWDLGHGTMPDGMRRIKIWMAIEVVEGESGLLVLPESQKRTDWAYHGEVDHTGIAKPKFDEDISQLNIYNVPTKSGDFIVFHDDLIHRGMANESTETRISLEATLLIPEKT